jgi:hypothetical protein
MVSDQDCDVEDLEFEDLESEVDRVQALCILEHVKLGKLGDPFVPALCIAPS